jgi:hypothetical protein
MTRTMTESEKNDDLSLMNAMTESDVHDRRKDDD